MAGGVGDVKPADPEIQAIVDSLKDAAQAQVMTE